jgi:hypothetical protein
VFDFVYKCEKVYNTKRLKMKAEFWTYINSLQRVLKSVGFRLKILECEGQIVIKEIGSQFSVEDMQPKTSKKQENKVDCLSFR